MSGNNSRKYKQYLELQERRRRFGDIAMKDEYGITDLVAFGASRGMTVIQSQRLTRGKSKKGNVKT